MSKERLPPAAGFPLLKPSFLAMAEASLIIKRDIPAQKSVNKTLQGCLPFLSGSCPPMKSTNIIKQWSEPLHLVGSKHCTMLSGITMWLKFMQYFPQDTIGFSLRLQEMSQFIMPPQKNDFTPTY